MLIANWNFDNSIINSVNNHNSHLDVDGYTDGVFGKSFTGIFHEGIPNLQTFSISLWIYFNTISDDWIVAKQESPTNYHSGWLIRSDTPSNILIFRIGDGSQDISIGEEMTTGQWYHVVATMDGHYSRLYVNSQLKAESNYISSIDYTGVGDMYVGAGSDLSRALNGNIDSLKIYDHELSQLEIDELYKLNVLAYKFIENGLETTNLFNDPDFDDSAVWSASKFYSSGGVDGGAYCGDTSTWGFKQTINVEAGYRYAVSGYVRMPSNSTTVRIALRNADMGNIYVNTGGEWTYFEDISGVVDTTGPNPIYILDSSKSGNEVQADKFQIEKREFVTPFVNGSRVGLAKDYSGNGYNANIRQATSPTWNSDSIIGEGSFHFNGVDQIIQVDDIDINEEISVFAWARPSEDIGANNIVGKRPGNEGWIIHNISTNLLKVYVNINGTWYSTTSTEPVYSIGVWSHVGFTYDGETLRGYADGAEVCQTTSPSGPIISKAGPIEIGGSTYPGTFAQMWPGDIADVRIYAKTLSLNDIQKLYQYPKISVDNKDSFWAYSASSGSTTKLYKTGHLEYGPRFNKNIIEGL